MDIKLASHYFAELGHLKRLQIIRLLVRAEPLGLTMGELIKAIDIPDSTLTHHVTKLERVNLIERVSEKTSIRCRVNLQALRMLSDFLLQECCHDNQKKC